MHTKKIEKPHSYERLQHRPINQALSSSSFFDEGYLSQIFADSSVTFSRASLRMRNVPTQGGVGVASITRSCWTMALHALEAIKYNEGRLEVLNQLLLPSQSVYEHITSVQEAWEAIRSMKVG